jgi:hypothetical protein
VNFGFPAPLGPLGRVKKCQNCPIFKKKIFSETAAPISTNFGTKHLWVKGIKHCEFHGLCPPPGALRVGQKLPKIDHFSNLLYNRTCGGKTECMVM